MTHTYNISNITCGGCVAKVTGQLLLHPAVTSAEVQIAGPQAKITMSKHLSITELQEAIGVDSKYKISKIEGPQLITQPGVVEERSWLVTYKPLLLIFAFITVVTSIAALRSGTDVLHTWMLYFMAGFFLVFSFFKMLNLTAFADSYAMYDLLAKKVPAYGYLYPFIELALGLAYLTGFNQQLTNITTVVVMGFSSFGVIRSVMNKQQIKCACLGAVFNLPMSTLTIIEDLLMVAMALAMLFLTI